MSGCKVAEIFGGAPKKFNGQIGQVNSDERTEQAYALSGQLNKKSNKGTYIK